MWVWSQKHLREQLCRHILAQSLTIWQVRLIVKQIKDSSCGTIPAQDHIQSTIDSNHRLFNSKIWGRRWKSQLTLFKASKIQKLNSKIKKVLLTDTKK